MARNTRKRYSVGYFDEKKKYFSPMEFIITRLTSASHSLNYYFTQQFIAIVMKAHPVIINI